MCKCYVVNEVFESKHNEKAIFTNCPQGKRWETHHVTRQAVKESGKSLESTNLLFHLCVRNVNLVIVTSRNNPFLASAATKIRILSPKMSDSFSEFVLIRCVSFILFKIKWN
jgi:hypothetical protein